MNQISFAEETPLWFTTAIAFLVSASIGFFSGLSWGIVSRPHNIAYIRENIMAILPMVGSNRWERTFDMTDEVRWEGLIITVEDVLWKYWLGNDRKNMAERMFLHLRIKVENRRDEIQRYPIVLLQDGGGKNFTPLYFLNEEFQPISMSWNLPRRASRTLWYVFDIPQESTYQIRLSRDSMFIYSVYIRIMDNNETLITHE